MGGSYMQLYTEGKPLTDPLSFPPSSLPPSLPPSQSTQDVIARTSKRCPSCAQPTTHYRNHGCHHIKPGTGTVEGREGGRVGGEMSLQITG